MARLFDFINEVILGKVIHTYDDINVEHGAITSCNGLHIREKKGVRKLFHKRVWEDGHTVKKWFEEYNHGELDLLAGVFVESLDYIAKKEAHDFGLIQTKQDGSMRSADYFYVESSGGVYYLFRRNESKAHSSSSTVVTYFPVDEVAALGDILLDALERCS